MSTASGASGASGGSDVNCLEFKLPDLGEGLTEAEIVRWLVEVGDVVAIDQPVVEVETAKALVEVPCPYGGMVTARFGDEGAELPVGSPLLTVTVGPEVGSGAAGSAGPAGLAGPGGPARASAADDDSSGNVLVGYGTGGAVAARRRRVRVADGTRPARTEPVASAVLRVGPVPVISPLVRRLAREHGVDLRGLTGSGPDGLILRSDVEQAIPTPTPAAGGTDWTVAVARTTGTGAAGTAGTAVTGTAAGTAVGTGSGSGSGPGSGTGVVAGSGAGTGPAGSGSRVPLRGMRGAVADKLARSRREIPDATCWVDADATELMAARAAMNAASGAGVPKISVLALLARVCTAALARFPELNSTVDTEAREIVRLPSVHLGFAAQTERGLVVPVVHEADGRTTESLNEEFIRLTEAARNGALTPGELTGGTFTLNNYGVFGVDGSTPIINHPEAAMLGVGRIVPKPWVHEGELAVREVVQLSLTFDHRVCDGGTAGGFLRYVADCVEQPAVLLRGV
ncbi:2-oxo acid dehydrogenase subunit E2 [Streptomyces sp. SID10853]|uniref:dihydrolipoamide acetyltransferase family protein n=1 Tax=Streptomyces sp. SID10853 TaxID=2706028 RepID=UPI0013C0DDD7|nr:dihydrolipoamide acetyltransferase family protein [Streptomyces sp. SID10853]NDZ79476.1 2-oxo acid dehydrogenase subunit E2 [Streptomyces sp. SID10853]